MQRKDYEKEKKILDIALMEEEDKRFEEFKNNEYACQLELEFKSFTFQFSLFWC